MILLTLGYVADAAVILTYLYLARSGRARPFHWANALGFVPVLLTELAVGAFVPLVLTAFFGLGGWYALLKGKR